MLHNILLFQNGQLAVLSLAYRSLAKLARPSSTPLNRHKYPGTSTNTDVMRLMTLDDIVVTSHYYYVPAATSVT